MRRYQLNRRGFLLATGSALLAPAIVHAADEPIRLGSVLSTTGPAAWLGDPEDKTLRMYVEEINKNGGVLGRKLQLFIYDDGSDAAKANSFGKRLIQQDNVDVILGAATTGTSLALVPLVEAAKVCLMSFGAARVLIDPVRPYVFKIPHSDTMAVQAVLGEMKSRGFRKIALISDTGGFGKSGRTETMKVAQQLGLTLTINESFGERDTDMTPLLTHVKQSDAEALLMISTGQAPAIIARNYKQLDLKLPLYTTHSQASYEFIRIAGPASEGIRMPTPALLLADSLPANDPQKKVTTNYKNAFEAKYKIDVSTFGGYAYDGLMIVVDAIKRAKSTEKAKLHQAIEQTRGFVGVSGIFTYSPTDHEGLDTSAFHMVEVKNGKFVEYKI
jgi:branched-chain amino acid transport system substrate-binding protein